jgi:hypothetical protein
MFEELKNWVINRLEYLNNVEDVKGDKSSKHPHLIKRGF